jgi:hypothetical protein
MRHLRIVSLEEEMCLESFFFFFFFSCVTSTRRFSFVFPPCELLLLLVSNISVMS